jgi:aromatic ring-opening dioxygenase LigB subunit
MIEIINKIFVIICGRRANRPIRDKRKTIKIIDLSVKTVQADLSNRLVVLHFHGVVLNDKVKVKTVSCTASLYMVLTEELNASEPLSRCRK